MKMQELLGLFTFRLKQAVRHALFLVVHVLNHLRCIHAAALLA